jgi:hypothetical protein
VNILQLRTEVEGLLASDLGTYTLPNGEITPSISVRADGEALPVRTRVNGLEVVILRDPDLAPLPQYENTGALRQWTVLLAAWTDTTDVESPVSKLVSVYGSQVSYLPVPRAAGPMRQARVTITTPSIPASFGPVAVGYRLLEGGGRRLLETGGYRLLES